MECVQELKASFRINQVDEGIEKFYFWRREKRRKFPHRSTDDLKKKL